MAQVIDAELHLEAIFRLSEGTLIDACVVDKHVNLGFFLMDHNKKQISY